MKRSLVLAVAAAATLLTATAANASRVSWSIGINLPQVATVVSGGPAYYVPSPGYYAPGSSYYSERSSSYYPEPSSSYYSEPSYGYSEPSYDYAPPVYSAPTYYRPHVYAPCVWVAPRPVWYGHDRWHHDGDRDRAWSGDRDGRDHRHDGRVDWRR